LGSRPAAAETPSSAHGASGAAAGRSVSVSAAAAAATTAAATAASAAAAGSESGSIADAWAATAVICTWNKKDYARANLESLRRQRRKFASVVVVDNASTDGTGDMVANEFPEARLVRMPHSKYGACETFNIGFASCTTPLVAILDDDIELPADWLEKCVARFQREPASTAIVSTKVVEPGMPDSYVNSPAVNRERYMSTFRGCGSLARASALREAGGYDEYLFIYGNERDLTCRLLNLGYRVLQYPEVVTHHKNPFGVRMGQRSLYFHARNAWITQLKYAPLEDLYRMPFLVVSKVLLRDRSKEESGDITDATGTIGIGKSLKETPGALWILVKAGFGVLRALPHCIRNRAPCTAADYELPVE
jgi:GT2 family glycosyltransferase